MIKVNRGGRSKKLPSEGPHPKREVPQPKPEFSLGLVGPGEGSPFVVIDSLGGDPHYKPEGLPDPSWPTEVCVDFDSLKGRQPLP